MDPDSQEEAAVIEKNILLNVSTLDPKKVEKVTRRRYLPTRYVVTFLMFLGMATSTLMRANLSIAIIAMTSKKVTPNGTILQAEFDWTPPQKGVILSLVAVGAVFAPFGGLISRKFGGATMYGLAIAAIAILTLLTPISLHFHLWVYGIVRILEGLMTAVSLPGYIDVLVHWTPPKERSRMVLWPTVGTHLGTAIAFQLSGFLAHYYGWEFIFYVTGCISLIWYVFWILLVSNQPSESRWITKDELRYLKNVIPDRGEDRKISKFFYKKMLTSPAAWAYINEYFSWGWISSFFSSGLPLYIKDVHEINVQNVGLIASIPLICCVIGLIVAPFLADYLRSRNILRIPTVHRIFISIGQCGAICFLLLIGLWADFTQSIICFSLLKFAASFTETSNSVLPIDMFGGYASLLKGWAITAGCISVTLNPVVMGFVASDHSRARWNLYFFFICIFNVWSTLVFYFFGSGERQLWVAPEKNEDNRNKEQELHLKDLVSD